MAAKKTPWEKPAPKKSKHSKLSDGQKSAAKTRAKKAGRHYPNLIDNMWASGKSKSPKKTAKKSKAK